MAEPRTELKTEQRISLITPGVRDGARMEAYYTALGHGAMTLAHDVRTRDEVAALMAPAESAGARALRPAGEIFWGGVIGYFAGPEGHIWEFAWNPGAHLSESGTLRWNGYA